MSKPDHTELASNYSFKLKDSRERVNPSGTGRFALLAPMATVTD